MRWAIWQTTEGDAVAVNPQLMLLEGEEKPTGVTDPGNFAGSTGVEPLRA